MASVAFQLIEEVTAHAQNDSLEDARGICADGTYFPNNLLTTVFLKMNPGFPDMQKTPYIKMLFYKKVHFVGLYCIINWINLDQYSYK